MGTKKNGKEKYLEDIQTIKDTLIRQEKRPVIEPWIFNSWTALVFIGTFIQFIINRHGMHHYDSIVVWIWVPIILTGGILEGIGWYRNNEKEGMLIKSKTNISLLHLLIIMCISSFLIYLVITNAGALDFLPVMFLVQAGVFFTVFISFTHTKFYFISETFIAAAIIFYVFKFTGPYADMTVGIIISALFFISGILYRKHIRQASR